MTRVGHIAISLVLSAQMLGCGDGKNKKQEPVKKARTTKQVEAPTPKPVTLPEVASVTKEAPLPTQVLSPVVPDKIEAPEPEAPKGYKDLVKQGRELRGQGDLDGAIESFSKAAEEKPHYITPQIELARLHVQKGDGDAAKPFAEQAIEIDPNSSKAWNTLGRVELARGDQEEAIAAFQAAVDANPDNSYAWNNLGYVYLKQQKFEEAKEALEAATSGGTVTHYMWNNLGMAYEHLSETGDAISAFRRGAEAGSKKAEASLMRLTKPAPEGEPVAPVE